MASRRSVFGGGVQTPAQIWAGELLRMPADEPIALILSGVTDFGQRPLGVSEAYGKKGLPDEESKEAAEKV